MGLTMKRMRRCKMEGSTQKTLKLTQRELEILHKILAHVTTWHIHKIKDRESWNLMDKIQEGMLEK